MIRMLVLQILEKWRQSKGYKPHNSLFLICMFLCFDLRLVSVHRQMSNSPFRFTSSLFSLNPCRMLEVWLHVNWRRHCFHILFLKLCTSKRLAWFPYTAGHFWNFHLISIDYLFYKLKNCEDVSTFIFYVSNTIHK